MKKSGGNPDIYRVDELTQLLPIGRDKAYRLMRSKAFPSIQIGRTYIVRKDDFDSWLGRLSYNFFK